MVLDTHVWLWWLSQPDLLSSKASEAIRRCVEARRPLIVSTISTWEVAMLLGKGRLQMAITAREWVRRSEALGLLDFVPVSNSIALRSVELEMHADPADRIIVATALELGLELLTKDEKLHALRLPTLW